MFGVNFLNYLTLFSLIVIHLENIFFFFYKKILYLSISRRKRLGKKFISFFFLSPKFILLYFFFTIIFFKVNIYNYVVLLLYKFYFLFFLFILLYWVVYSFLYKMSQNINAFTIFLVNSLFIVIFFLSFCRSYLVYLFFIEIFSIYYYFFFLSIYPSHNSINVYSYKNFLLYYVWNSYLTTLFFSFGLIGILVEVGSLDFYFLSFFSLPSIYIFFLVISLAWKLGLPGFHFFKLQVYQYLDSFSLFFFSIYSLLFNLVLFTMFLLQPSVLSYIISSFLYLISFIFFFNIFIFFFNIVNFYQFLGLSSIITLFNVISILLFY